MVVFVPIPISVPSPSVFIPPTVAMLPAPFTCGNQFSAPGGYLWAVPAVFLSGFVQFMINMNDALLAVFISARPSWAKQQKSSG